MNKKGWMEFQYFGPDKSISFWAKVREFEKSFYKYNLAHSGVRFIKKDVFWKVGGFDETLIANEDYDFCNRVVKKGFKIGFIDSEEKHLGEPRSIYEIIRKNYYYGKTILRFLRKNKTVGFLQVSPIRRVFLANWKIMLRGVPKIERRGRYEGFGCSSIL